jgi:glycyl-tRNA synthetase
LECPNCHKKDFDVVTNRYLLASTNLGMFTEEDPQSYLRGETAQGIYINFKNILDTVQPHLPFGIAQVGKAFRNEISPRQFLFRKREFEQMEMQYFVNPKEATDSFEEWKKERMSYYEKLGLKKEKLRWKQHENLVFYAKDAWDIEYEFPFGWGELEGIHYRGDYDLTQHQQFSGTDLSYFDEETKQRYIPHVVETSVGLDRTMLAVLSDAYTEDEMGEEKRIVMKFPKEIAPVRAAVFPLLKNKPELVAKAREVYAILKKEIPNVEFDDNGNIGKRYRRQDEIGTPHCITVDFDTLGENPGLLDTVTLRDRDSGEQKRVKISELPGLLK